MKTKIAGVLLVLVLGFTVIGCTSTDVKSNTSGEYMFANIAGKDFTVLGFVTVNTTEEIRISPLKISTDWKGERVTYDLLLQEAKKLYPSVSDIINVRVDQISQGRTSLLDYFTGTTRTNKYIGNALAIEYTGTHERSSGTVHSMGSAGFGPADAAKPSGPVVQFFEKIKFFNKDS